MKRQTLAAVIAIACGACQPDAKPPVTVKVEAKVTPANTAVLCTAPITKDVAFTSPAAKDILEFDAIGADCRQSVLVTSIRTADGKLIVADGGPAADTTVFAGIEQDGTSPEKALHTMIDAWLKDMSIRTTADAPDWKDGRPRPEEPSGLYIGTDWPRADYIAERAARRPMLCVMSFQNRTTCYAWKAEDSAAYKLYDMRS